MTIRFLNFTIKTSEKNGCSSNVLISSVILGEPPLPAGQKAAITTIFLKCWDALMTTLPFYVFKASYIHAAGYYFPSDRPTRLDHVFVEFTMNYTWACEESILILKSILQKETLLYSPAKSPFHAYISFFQNPILSESLKIKRKEFFSQLTIEATNILGAMKSTSGLGSSAVRRQSQTKYDFVTNPTFPKNLIEFLCDCLEACPPDFLAVYFDDLISKMNLDRPQRDVKSFNAFEVLAVSMIISKDTRTNLIDEFMKALIINGDPPRISGNFVKLTLGSDIVVSFVNNSNNLARSFGSEIQRLLLESDYTQNLELFKKVREWVQPFLTCSLLFPL